MTEIFIAGIGMTRFGKHLESSIKDLVNEAVNDALADAGCDKSQIQEAYFTSNATRYLARFQKLRKVTFIIEYEDGIRLRKYAIERAREHGLLLLITDTALSSMGLVFLPR